MKLKLDGQNHLYIPVRGSDKDIYLCRPNTTKARAVKLDKDFFNAVKDPQGADMASWLNMARFTKSEDSIKELQLWAEAFEAEDKIENFPTKAHQDLVAGFWDTPLNALYKGLKAVQTVSILEAFGISPKNSDGSEKTYTDVQMLFSQWQNNPDKVAKQYKGVEVSNAENTGTGEAFTMYDGVVNKDVTFYKLGNTPASSDFNIRGFKPEGFIGAVPLNLNKGNVGANPIGITAIAKLIVDGITPVRLVGPPGCGKSIALRWIADQLGLDCDLIPCSEGLSDEQILGMFKPVENGGIEWVDGQLTRIVRKKEGMIIFDEVDHLPASIQSRLHQFLAERRITLQNGEIIELTPAIKLAFTANTEGHGNLNRKHGAAKISDHAFLSRLPIVFRVTYMPKEVEKKLLTERYGVPDTEAQAWVNLAAAARLAIDQASVNMAMSGAPDQVLTIRETQAYGELRKIGFPPTIALGAVLNGFNASDNTIYATAATKHGLISI